MEENKNSTNGALLAFTSFFSSVIAIFTMYYIFACIALITGLLGLRHENSRSMSITAIIIVVVSFVIKMINTLIISGTLPQWLINGMI